MINPSIFSRNCSAILTPSLRSGSMDCWNMITLDSRVAITPPVPPLRRGSAEDRSSSLPEARLPSNPPNRPRAHCADRSSRPSHPSLDLSSLSRCRDVSIQVKLLYLEAITAGLPAKTPHCGWPTPGYPPGAAPDLHPPGQGAPLRLILCGSWEFPLMEFWRTDEIAPVVLIILLELMRLGLINYTMPI
jgi:hypothetical protein